MKNKKILFVYRTRRKNVLRQWRQGKASDTLLYSANHLGKMGYEIGIFDYSYSPFNVLHPIFYPLEHGIVKSVGMGFKIDQAMSLLPLMKKYDVIVATGDSAGLPILALKKYGLLKTPVIHITAGLAGALRGKEHTRVFGFYKQIMPHANVSVAYSQIEIEFFEKYMGFKKGQMKQVPLGVDYDYFSQKSNLKKTIVCAVGFDSCRDYSTFFDAIKDINIQAEIVCYPNNISNLNIPSNVKVHTYISIEAVRKIYQRSIVSVIPSYEKYRSSGQIVFLESASASLPIVATRIKGLTTAFKLKDDFHLLYCAQQNARDMNGKIKFLLSNAKKRKTLGDNASQLVKENYTTKHLASRLASFIEKL